MNSDVEARVLEAPGPVVLVVMPNREYAQALEDGLRAQYKDLVQAYRAGRIVVPEREILIVTEANALHGVRGKQVDTLILHPQIEDYAGLWDVLGPSLMPPRKITADDMRIGDTPISVEHETWSWGDTVIKAWRYISAWQQGCPNDTNGDGDCGRRHCPFCGEPKTQPLPLGRSQYAQDGECGTALDYAGEVWCAQEPGHKGPCKLA